MTALVLTGNIAPNTPETVINEPSQRAAEYARSIRSYLEAVPYPLHFVENSDHDLGTEPELAPVLRSERVHLHREKEPGDPERGKGYEEFRMIDGLVRKLQAEGYERLIKITGRYIVRNINALIPKGNEHAYIDLHPRIKSGIAITAFFVCPVHYYREHIEGAYQEVDERERITIEKVLFERLNGLRSDAPRLLHREPIFEGISGTTGNPIGRNPYRRAVRNTYRQFLRISGQKRILHEL